MADLTLQELRQRVEEKRICEAKQKELTLQRGSVSQKVRELKEAKQLEQADVDRLQGRSLAAFFYQVTGKMEEKLDQERREAYAARVKYDAAVRELSSIEADLHEMNARLRALEGCEKQYQQALSEKLKSIQATDSAAAQQLAESEARMAKLQGQKKELTEAVWAGKDALRTTNQVLETLDSAKGWSTWDIVGGGLLVDIAKHRELDHAQEQVEQLQIDLRRFKTELVDVEITAELQVSVDGFLKFADFFFDGLFADWAVLDHIKQAQEQVENTKQQIEQVLAMLNTVQQETETGMAKETQKQEQLAVNTVL